MSTEAKVCPHGDGASHERLPGDALGRRRWPVGTASQPRHSATAIPALAAPAFALPQTAVIPGMRGMRGMAQSLHTGTGVRSPDSPKPDRRPEPGHPR
jgi:hypothetical protein